MPDQTQNNSQQIMIYALVAIAVLLAAIVGLMIYQRTTAIPGPSAATSTTPATAAGTGAAATGSTSTGSASVAPAAFDAKTATKLPSGMTPEQAIKKYNDAVLANKFDVAYDLLPLAQKTSYASPDGMASQVKGYNISAFKVGKFTTNGDETSVVVETENPSMPITYTWTFAKSGGTWYVKSRVMGGSL